MECPLLTVGGWRLCVMIGCFIANGLLLVDYLVDCWLLINAYIGCLLLVDCLVGLLFVN